VLPTAKLVISPHYDASMLAATLCRRLPCALSKALWQQQGYSSECRFMEVTTQTLRAEQLQALSNEVSHERSPLVCRAACRGVAAAQAADC
jgi:adenine-specific DNA-methyltransferase